MDADAKVTQFYMQRRWVSLSEAALILSQKTGVPITYYTVVKWAKKGKFTTMRVGGRLFVLYDDLEKSFEVKPIK